MRPVRVGAIGAGGFGLFALQQFLQSPCAQLVALAGTNPEAALAMQRRFGVQRLADTRNHLVHRTQPVIQPGAQIFPLPFPFVRVLQIVEDRRGQTQPGGKN